MTPPVNQIGIIPFFSTSVYIAHKPDETVLKDTLLKFFKLDGLIDNLTGYVEARIELMKLELKEDLAHGLARMVFMLTVTVIMALFVLLISVAAAFKLSETLGNFAGFSIVAGVYLVLALGLIAMRKPITESLEKKLAERMQKKKK